MLRMLQPSDTARLVQLAATQPILADNEVIEVVSGEREARRGALGPKERDISHWHV